MSKLQLVKKVSDEDQHQGDVEGVRIEGGKIITCGDDGKVKIFDGDLKLLKEIKAHDYAVYDVIVFGETLFTCSIDASVKSWDFNTLELKKVVGQHEEGVRKFCTDGKLIYAGDEKAEVKGYTPEGDLKVTYNVVEEVWGLYAKEDLLYSVRDRGVTVTQLKGEDNKFTHVKSLDGRAPLYVHGNWLVFPDVAALTLEIHDNNRSSSFAHKGTLKGPEMIITALGGCGDRVASGGYDLQLSLWDLSKMAQIAKCYLPEVPNGIAVNAQGDIYVVGAGGYICKYKLD